MTEGAVGMDPGVAALAARHELGPDAQRRLGLLLRLLVEDPSAPTSITTDQAVLEDHLADSLVGLECPALRGARSVLDLGSGAGVPGLPLAIALSSASFTLLESSSRKVRFLRHAIEVCELTNAEVTHVRAESFSAGLGRYDVITARAVAPLPVVLEYAAPLLRLGGTLIVWRGRREPELEEAARRAASELGLGTPRIEPVRPCPRVEHRHLYAIAKLHETPARFPRRAGVALKHPLGQGRHNRPSSDRVQR